MKIFLVTFLLIGFSAFAQQIDIIPFEESNKWGYKKNNGEVVITPQYEYATKFYNGLAKVFDNQKMGVIDSLGNIVLPIKYEYLSYINDNHFVFGYRTKYFGEYRKGIIDKNEKILIKPIFNHIKFVNGSYEVTLNKESITCTVGGMNVRSVQSFYGIYNQDGREILPAIYDRVKWADEELIVLSKNNSDALYDNNGKEILGFEYSYINKFHDGLAFVKKDQKCGYISKKGYIKIPIIYDNCMRFIDKKAFIGIDDKWGVVNSKGDIIVSVEHTYAYIMDYFNKTSEIQITEDNLLELFLD